MGDYTSKGEFFNFMRVGCSSGAPRFQERVSISCGLEDPSGGIIDVEMRASCDLAGLESGPLNISKRGRLLQAGNETLSKGSGTLWRCLFGSNKSDSLLFTHLRSSWMTLEGIRLSNRWLLLQERRIESLFLQLQIM